MARTPVLFLCLTDERPPAASSPTSSSPLSQPKWQRRRQGHASSKEMCPLPLPGAVHAKHPRSPPRTCHVRPGHVPCPTVMPCARAWHHHGPQTSLLPSDTPKPPRIRFGFANRSPTTPWHHKPRPRAHHSPPFSPSTHPTICYLILAKLDL
jgi:hypothetical protein